MKVTEIREKAKQLGISYSRMKKGALIHAIQEKEGYTSCFGSKSTCDELVCCWREDCLPKTSEIAT